MTFPGSPHPSLHFLSSISSHTHLDIVPETRNSVYEMTHRSFASVMLFKAFVSIFQKESQAVKDKVISVEARVYSVCISKDCTRQDLSNIPHEEKTWRTFHLISFPYKSWHCYQTIVSCEWISTLFGQWKKDKAAKETKWKILGRNRSQQIINWQNNKIGSDKNIEECLESKPRFANTSGE